MSSQARQSLDCFADAGFCCLCLLSTRPLGFVYLYFDLNPPTALLAESPLPLRAAKTGHRNPEGLDYK